MANEPIITCSVVDVNPVTVNLTGNNKILIRYFSSAKATMTATAHTDAVINNDMYIIRNADETAFGTEHTFEHVSDNVFRFSAEDSRGRVGSETLMPLMIEYVPVGCRAISTRPDASGNMTVMCGGSYFDGNFGRYYNTLTVKYRYREVGGEWSSYASMSVETTSGSYTASASLSGLDYKKAYEFEFEAKDRIRTTGHQTASVRSVPVFHWGENDVVFEVPVTFKAGTTGGSGGDSSGGSSSEVDGDMNVAGDLRLQVGNYGTHLYFGDGEYCYLAELSDDNLTIKASTINFETNRLKHNGEFCELTDYGEWTPDLSIYNFSFVENSGWYTKTGNVVTVGFRIKATCYGDNTGSTIIIYGLPYTPAVSASGGGVCSGAYMTGNMNFQCFVAEDDGSITVRSQSCTVSAGQNLSTSASGARYPSNGGEITLSGTITYMV